MIVQPSTQVQPVVAVLSAVPLFTEALAMELEGIAETQAFPAEGRDVNSFFRWLGPTLIVVDERSDSAAAMDYARETNVPLVRVSLRDQAMAVLEPDGWRSVSGATPLSTASIKTFLLKVLTPAVEPA
jgi:hypothetical protein